MRNRVASENSLDFEKRHAESNILKITSNSYSSTDLNSSSAESYALNNYRLGSEGSATGWLDFTIGSDEWTERQDGA